MAPSVCEKQHLADDQKRIARMTLIHARPHWMNVRYSPEPASLIQRSAMTAPGASSSFAPGKRPVARPFVQ
jgi:hypothetical protein